MQRTAFHQENYIKDTGQFGVYEKRGLWNEQSVNSSNKESSSKEESDSDKTTAFTVDTPIPNIMKPSPPEDDFDSSSIYSDKISEHDEYSKDGDD